VRQSSADAGAAEFVGGARRGGGLLILGELEGERGGEAHAPAAAGGVDAGEALGVLAGVDGLEMALGVLAAEVGRDGGGDRQAVGGVEEGRGEIEAAEGRGGEVEADGRVVEGGGGGTGCGQIPEDGDSCGRLAGRRRSGGPERSQGRGDKFGRCGDEAAPEVGERREHELELGRLHHVNEAELQKASAAVQVVIV
jgi:hypothetical protein